MAWTYHSDPFNLVDRPHKAKKARKVSRHLRKGSFHHMKFRTFYDTKSNPASKDRIPVPRA